MAIKVTYYKDQSIYIDRRFYTIVIVLIFMWIGLMTFFYLKADEVTKDPCSICSIKMGKEVVCTVKSSILMYKTFYPNGSSDIYGAGRHN